VCLKFLFSELKLQNDTTKEENRLLKQRLAEMEKGSSMEAAEQLREKLRKKQVTVFM